MSSSDSELDLDTSERHTAPITAHSAGERSEENHSDKSSSTSSSSSDGSSSSASSPSDNETSQKDAQQRSGSATSPSSGSDTTDAPSTSKRAHSARKPPASTTPVKRPPSRRLSSPIGKYALGRGSTPPVSPNYVKPAIRQDAKLEKRTTAQTVREFRDEINRKYIASLPSWDRQKWPEMAPQAFTDEWFQHEFCQRLVKQYHELLPTVMARQAQAAREAAALQAVIQPAEQQMDTDQPASSAAVPAPEQPSTVTIDDGELSGLDDDPIIAPYSDEQLDKIVEEWHAEGLMPPASTVLSKKPPSKPKAKTTQATDKPRSSSAHQTAHSAGAAAHDASQKNKEATNTKHKESEKRTVASVKRREYSSTQHSSRSSTSSKRSRDASLGSRPPPTKDARHDDQPPAEELSPSLIRHQQRVAATKRRGLVPILDGHVDKALAVYVAQNGHRQHSWVKYFARDNLKYELIGVISCYGVPASYLPAENCNANAPAGTHTPLAHIVYGQLRTENAIVPWDFILGITLGALPPYWRQCTSYTRKHLEKKLDASLKYRDLQVCAIGPVGIDLRGWPVNEVKDPRGLVIVIHYDQEPTHTYSVHADVINALKEAGISSRQRIHLIFSKGTAYKFMLWLEYFPRTLISFDFDLLGDIRKRLGVERPDPTDQDYLQAYARQDFLKYVPLQNLALHSGCPQPNNLPLPGFHKNPADLVAAGTEFQLLTGTRADVLYANNARNLVNFYNLDHRLLDYSVSGTDHRDKTIGDRLPLAQLINKIRLLYGLAPQGAQQELAQAEQERRPRRSPSVEVMEQEEVRAPSTSRQRSHSTATSGKSRRRSPSNDDRRRGRSPVKRPSPIKRREDHHQADKKSSKDRGRQETPHSGERHRSRTPHSGDKHSKKARDTFRSPPPPPRRPSERSPRRSSTASNQRRSPNPTKFVVNFDTSPQEYASSLLKKPEASGKPPPKPIRLCDVQLHGKMPLPVLRTTTPRLEGRVSRASSSSGTSSRLEGRIAHDGKVLPTTSRLEGRLARDGQILPTSSSGVREKVKTLKLLYGDQPKPSVLEQIRRLRNSATEPNMPQTAHSAGQATTTLHTPDQRLIKDPPMFSTEMLPAEIRLDQLYDEALKIFQDGQPNKSGLRPIDAEMLASYRLEPAQPHTFEVTRHPDAEANPFHPYHICNGDDEDTAYFQQPVALAGLVTSKRWARQQGIRDVKLMENLLARVKLLKVRSLAQMVLIKYIDRLRSNDVDRTPAALEFLYEVLTARNLRRELPELLKRYQPQITDDDTNDPWPTRMDFRHALDNWSCYCVHAAIYVMEHLSGPIVYEPDWLALEDLSQESYQSIVIDMIDDHAGVLNALRHQMYRQYVHAFMEAIKVGLEANAPRHADGASHRPLRGPPILIDMANRDSVIEQVLHYFPHSTTTRVVFWFSSDYTRAGKKGLRYILAALSYHYATHLGRIEQFVVLPTYVRHKREIWTREVLNAYFQRKTVMPFARVALGPLDLRLWERDDRELRAGGDLKDWDSYGVNGIDEDGHYVLEELIGATKVYLRQHHDLDLWINEETTSSRTSPSTMETSTSDHHHTSSASGSRQTATSAILQAPSTSGQRAHSVPGVDLEAIAANMAKKLPNKGTTPEEQAIIASALEYI
ncbi:hypothetical protein AAVH_07162 [Aphelenchoides avenae]|nr:hypothetical protein AAVH_07162 [Aphelenchus avenae]